VYQTKAHRKTGKIKGKAVLELNKLSYMPWRQIGEWRYSSILLDLCTKCRWMVSFML
jgi:hypothetical protein